MKCVGSGNEEERSRRDALSTRGCDDDGGRLNRDVLEHHRHAKNGSEGQQTAQKTQIL